MPRSRSRSDSRDGRRRRHSRRHSPRERGASKGSRTWRREERDVDDRSRRRGRRSSGERRRHQRDDRSDGRDRRRRSIDRDSVDDSRSQDSKDPAQPNMKLSGKLAAETNKVGGTVLKFSEPAEAQIPNDKWRLYVFKNGDVMGDPIPLHRRSCFLFGRDRNVCDIPTDHPSCSKQHCVLQFRCVEIEDGKTGLTKDVVKPYLMDLMSINGTSINKQKMESSRYYELLEQDTIRLGMSTREYVVLREDSLS